MKKYPFKAGAGSAPIVFPQDMFPTDKLNGVHENPYARILVLDGGERAAIAAIEHVNLDPIIGDLRQIIADETGTKYENVWIHVTHAITTPHPPAGMGPPPGMKPGAKPMGGPPKEKDPKAEEKNALFNEAVYSAVRMAAIDAADLKAARYGAIKGKTNVNINRDFETPFGWWVKQNPEEYSNKELLVLRVEQADGTPLAVFVSADLKPCCIDQAGRNDGTAMVDPDVPGYACRVLSEEIGAPVLFAMAAAGDQVSREQAFWEDVDDKGQVFQVDLGVEKGYEIVEKLGKEMAEEIKYAMAGITCNNDKASVVCAHADVPVERRQMARRQSAPVKEIEFIPDGEAMLGAEAISLGEDFAFVGVKPEVNSIISKTLKENSPFESTAMLSMVNGGMKYMPDAQSYDRCTWEAGSTALMKGSAEKWADGACALLKNIKEETLGLSAEDDSLKRGPGGPSQAFVSRPASPDFDGRGPAGPVPSAAGNPNGVPKVPRY